jgi:ribosome-binding protein aMBF1 (putative translation factor)
MKKSSTRKPEKTRDALRIIDHMVGGDAGLKKLIVEAGVNAHIAQLIYDTRVAAGLTQSQLAKLIGTKQPVIARLEDADYHGHSLTMLHRIAEALNRRLELRFVPGAPPHHQAKAPRERLRA